MYIQITELYILYITELYNVIMYVILYIIQLKLYNVYNSVIYKYNSVEYLHIYIYIYN